MPAQSAPTTTAPLPQYSLWRSFLLNVIPGLLVTAAFVLFRQLLAGSGTPPLLAIRLLDLPLLLGVLFLPAALGPTGLQGAVANWHRSIGENALQSYYCISAS